MLDRRRQMAVYGLPHVANNADATVYAAVGKAWRLH